MNSQPERPSLVLTRLLDDGTLEWIPIQIPQRMAAEPGAAYTLIDRAEYEAPQTLVARRLGDDLVIEVEGIEVLVLDGFYTTPAVAFHPTTDIAGGGGPFSDAPLTPESPTLVESPVGEQVVWQASQREDEVPGEDNEQGERGSSPLLWGGLAAGGLGLLALAGGGGGGGSGSDVPAGIGDDGGTDIPAPTQKTVVGTVVAGPVISGNGLSVELFQADGTTRLGAATVAADGSFAIDVGNYTGVIIARVVDADSGEDFLDEATEEAMDLNVNLSGLRELAENDTTLNMNLNPLTTLAAALTARQAGDGAPTVAQATQNNAAIAGLFGLSNLHGITVEPVNGGAWDAGDGLSPAENYGAMLAAFSGATANNGGDGQQTIDEVLAGLSVSSSGQASLSASAQALLVQGARTTEARTGEGISDIVASALDPFAPQITSGATAPAIDENSGAGQVVYTARASDDGTVTWSLAPGGDAAAFSIDADTGAVTLTGDPDFETRSGYSFTVIATDAVGNSSELAVSLAINDLDDTGPSVVSVALTDASGALNDWLNGGDTVSVTVTMSERTDVDTAGGVPRIALTIGASTVFADYTAGSGTTSLTFDYVVQSGDDDSDGISIPANALEANGAAVTDAAGNAADLDHGGVADNDAYLVDTAVPTLSSTTPAQGATAVAVGDDIVLTFSEDVQAGSGNITIREGGVVTRVIDVADTSQVTVSGSQVIIDPAADLDPGTTYTVQVDPGALTDRAGNAYAGIDDNATFEFETASDQDLSIVVFDLVEGSSSDHSGRSFDSGVSYDIYIRVDSEDAELETSGDGPGAWGTWSGAANLGSDDRVILVGSGDPIEGPFGGDVIQVSANPRTVAWQTAAFGFNAAELQGRTLTRITDFDDDDIGRAILFDTSLPAAFFVNQGEQINTMYLTNLPAGILTSQGLV